MTTITDELAQALEAVLNSSYKVEQDPLRESAYLLLKRYRKGQESYREDTVRIIIDFPVKVNIPDRNFQQLVEIVGDICKEYEEHHPARVMWAAGMGSLITYMPMTREEEQAGKHIEFDDNVLSISCAEREDYKWPCAKCDKEQGDHKGMILDPPAGNCDFEPFIKQ